MALTYGETTKVSVGGRFLTVTKVTLDNEYKTWNAFGNQYWPRKYLIDIDGYIVFDHAGEGGYDNADPRAWLARQTDWRARANAAQANSFEALPFFIGAVIIAHQLGAHQARLDILAFMFVVLRLLYIMMYVSGMANLRSG